MTSPQHSFLSSVIADGEGTITNEQEQHSESVDLSRPSIPYILTFLCSISQEGVVEEKDVMQPSASIKVTEGKLTVIYSGILCNKIFFSL